MAQPLIIIPARGGSKGIPRKNIKLLNGKPLIHYTIEVARQVAADGNIIVSTEDEEIAAIAAQTGLEIPYRRPIELAQDHSSSQEVIVHAMNWAKEQGKEFDCVVLLQPTSPLRQPEDVRECLQLYTPAIDMVTTVVDAACNPFYDTFSRDAEGFLKIAAGDGHYTRRQDAPKAWQLNGAVYVINPRSVQDRPMGSFEKRLGVEMPEERSIDLDTLADWEYAEQFMAKNSLIECSTWVEEVSVTQYERQFPHPYHVFNSPAFSELNSGKCQEVKYLFFHDREGKVRIGLVAGLRNGVISSPFSAPFGGFDFNKDERIDKLTDAVTAFNNYLKLHNLKGRITLPPAIYNPEMVPKMEVALGRPAFIDINYHYPLDEEREQSPAAKRNLKTSLKQNFALELSRANDEALARAYAVVKANHEEHGYPVHMGLDDLLATSKVIEMDVFILTHDHNDVAAAIIYHSAPGIVQLIYWGDLSQYRPMRPMNYLSNEIINHYRAAHERIFDLGPASSEGIPAPGLCDFKEGIGCVPSLKSTFRF